MKRNSDFFGEFITGLFMVVVVALLAYFTIVISGVDILVGRTRVQTTVQFADVGGLKTRDNVIYRGMKVGSVEAIELGRSNVTVRLSVDSDVILRETGCASVQALSLLGGNYLMLEEGQGAVCPLATTVFRGETPVDFMRALNRLAKGLEGDDGAGGVSGLVKEFRETGSALNRIIERVERGEGTVGRLLSADNSLYTNLYETVASARRAVSTAERALAGAETTFTNAAVVSARVVRGEGTLGKLLSTNETVYADIKATLAHAADVSGRLARGEGTLGKLLTEEDAWRDLRASLADVRAVTADVRAGKGLLGRLTADTELSENAAQLVANLKGVSEKLSRGEGALGKLVSDPALYDEVNALIRDIRQVVDNYRDTTPISTFGALATGAL